MPSYRRVTIWLLPVYDRRWIKIALKWLAHWRLPSANLCPLVMWNRRVCVPRQTKDDAMPQAYTCSWTKAVHSLKYSSFVMLLEAPQIWRMKRYNVLETELVYTSAISFNSLPNEIRSINVLSTFKEKINKYNFVWVEILLTMCL